MPGDDWQKYANLRLLFGYMYAHPGKKLLFMGGEFAQWPEWHHDKSLDWHALDFATHQGVRQLVKDLNIFYRSEPALYEVDFEQAGFEWLDCGDFEKSILSFVRRGSSKNDLILAVCNLTSVPRYDYRIGVPVGGHWQEMINSDACEYGGSGLGNFGGVLAEPISMHGRPNSLVLTLPPLSIVILKYLE